MELVVEKVYMVVVVVVVGGMMDACAYVLIEGAPGGMSGGSGSTAGDQDEPLRRSSSRGGGDETWPQVPESPNKFTKEMSSGFSKLSSMMREGGAKEGEGGGEGERCEVSEEVSDDGGGMIQKGGLEDEWVQDKEAQDSATTADKGLRMAGNAGEGGGGRDRGKEAISSEDGTRGGSGIVGGEEEMVEEVEEEKEEEEGTNDMKKVQEERHEEEEDDEKGVRGSIEGGGHEGQSKNGKADRQMETLGESFQEYEVRSSGQMAVDGIVKVAESDGGAVGHSEGRSGEAALTLQRVFRGFLAREHVRKLLQKLMLEAQQYYEMGGQEQYYGVEGEQQNDGMQQYESASSVEPERDVETDSIGLNSKAVDSAGGVGDVNAAVQGSKPENYAAAQGEGIAQGDLESVSQDADDAQGDESASSVEAERDAVVAEPGHAGDSEGIGHAGDSERISDELGRGKGAGDRGVSGDLMGGDTSSDGSGSMTTSSPPGSPPASPPTEASSRCQSNYSDAGGGGGGGDDDDDDDDDDGHHTPPLAPMESERGGVDGDDNYDDDNDFIEDEDSDDSFDQAADEVMSSSTSRLTESRASASSRPMSAVRAGTGRPESASGSERRDEGSSKWQRGLCQSDDF